MNLATVLVLAFAATAFAQQQPAPAPAPAAKEAEPKEMVKGTVADAQLEADIKGMLRIMEGADHPGCKLKIVKQFHSADKPGVERWEVKSCDTTSSYEVTMVRSLSGGTDFHVRKFLQEQEKTANTAAQPPVISQVGAAGALPEASGTLPESAGAVPEGFVVYEGQKSQFTIALPQGWVAYGQSNPLAAHLQLSLIVFYFHPNTTSQDTMFLGELLGKIDTGEVPAFFVQRFLAEKGMSCGGFSDTAEKHVFKWVTSDSAFGMGVTMQGAYHSERTPVAGCQGIRIHGTGQPPKKSTPWANDVYAVSDGTILYFFTLRGHADYYKKNADIFQKSVATARLTAAK
jgi:hypothetical protein